MRLEEVECIVDRPGCVIVEWGGRHASGEGSLEGVIMAMGEPKSCLATSRYGT